MVFARGTLEINKLFILLRTVRRGGAMPEGVTVNDKGKRYKNGCIIKTLHRSYRDRTNTLYNNK